MSSETTVKRTIKDKIKKSVYSFGTPAHAYANRNKDC